MDELEAKRQQTIDRLAAGYAADSLDLDELERRMDRAERASSSAELEPLVADLPGGQALVPAGAASGLVPAGDSSGLAVTQGSTALVPAAEVPERRSMVTIFGSVSRDRSWTVPRRLRVVSVFGSTDLDFRKARMAPGTTEVRVTSVMAGVRVLVPPGLPVEVDGVGILGAFEQRFGEEPSASEPPCRLRISGVALLSGVEVEDRLPGESGRQARRRRKQDRRALKAARTDRLLQARREPPEE